MAFRAAAHISAVCVLLMRRTSLTVDGIDPAA